MWKTSSCLYALKSGNDDTVDHLHTTTRPQVFTLIMTDYSRVIVNLLLMYSHSSSRLLLSSSRLLLSVFSSSDPLQQPAGMVYDFNFKPNIHGWKRSSGCPNLSRWADSIKHDLNSASLDTTNAAQMVFDMYKYIWKHMRQCLDFINRSCYMCIISCDLCMYVDVVTMASGCEVASIKLPNIMYTVDASRFQHTHVSSKIIVKPILFHRILLLA